MINPICLCQEKVPKSFKKKGNSATQKYGTMINSVKSASSYMTMCHFQTLQGLKRFFSASMNLSGYQNCARMFVTRVNVMPHFVKNFKLPKTTSKDVMFPIIYNEQSKRLKNRLNARIILIFLGSLMYPGISSSSSKAWWLFIQNHSLNLCCAVVATSLKLFDRLGSV